MYPGEDEDFGIVPVEAMGYGVPVIGHNSGGPRETILDQKTGVLFESLTVEGLVQAIEKFKTIKFNSELIHKHALQFRKEVFLTKIAEFVKNC